MNFGQIGNQILSFFLIALVLCSCRNKYDKIDPKLLQVGNIIVLNSQGDSLNCYFISSVPSQYDPAEKYPIFIALHGYGSSAEAFFPVWKEAADSLGFILLVPQGEDIAGGGIGFSWDENTEQIILTSLSVVQEKVNIDPSRIYISGFSQGGIQACYIALKHSLLFKGFASICSPLDKNIIKNKIPLNVNARAYISCGEMEENIKSLSSAAAIELKRIGYITTYVEYKNLGHSIPAPIQEELIKIITYLDK